MDVVVHHLLCHRGQHQEVDDIMRNILCVLTIEDHQGIPEYLFNERGGVQQTGQMLVVSVIRDALSQCTAIYGVQRVLALPHCKLLHIQCPQFFVQCGMEKVGAARHADTVLMRDGTELLVGFVIIGVCE